MEWTSEEEDNQQKGSQKDKTKSEKNIEKKAKDDAKQKAKVEKKASKLRIRNATILDTTLIVMLMKELKKYEKSSKPIASEKDLKKHLFGKKPKAQVLIL
jgi:hypothetical protein